MFQFLPFYRSGQMGEILMPVVLLTMIVFIKKHVSDEFLRICDVS